MTTHSEAFAVVAPLWVSLIFGATVLLAAALIGRVLTSTSTRQGLVWSGLAFWLLLQGGLAYGQVYYSPHTAPRLVVLGVLPALLLTGWLASRPLVLRLDVAALTRLSVIRIPVEIVLYSLAIAHLVPGLMTFAGRNLDILAGLTAPVVAYWFVSGIISRRWLLVWHVFALLLLLNIIVLAALSLPTPLQKLAFDQPNLAPLRFPFVWLPTFIVPAVLFSHLASLRLLLLPQPTHVHKPHHGLRGHKARV